MPQNKNWLIIGQGIIGLTLAYRMLQSGFKVTLLSPPNSKPEASLAAQGVLSSKGLLKARNSLFRAKLEGQGMLFNLAESLEAEVKQKVERIYGASEIFATEKEYTNLLQRIYHHEFLGLIHSEVIASKDFKKGSLEAAISGKRDILGAFHYPRDGWVSPDDFIRSLKLAVRERSAKLLEGTAIKIIPGDCGLEVITSEQKKLVFDEVIVASGHKSFELLKTSGIRDIPFVKVPGQVITINNVDLPSGVLKQGRRSLAIYGGKLRYGSTDLRQKGIKFPLEYDEKKAILTNEISKLLKSNRLEPHKVLYGERLKVSDRMPLLGEYKCGIFKQKSIWLATGFYKNGYQLADLSAHFLVDVFLGKKTKKYMDDFDPNRFSTRT